MLSDQMVIDGLEMYDVEHKKVFVKGAPRRAISGLAVSILESESEIRESFESAFVQAATSSIAMSEVVNAIVTDASTLDPIAKLAVEAVRSKVAASAIGSVVLFPS